jgi:hypothetical protein
LNTKYTKNTKGDAEYREPARNHRTPDGSPFRSSVCAIPEDHKSIFPFFVYFVYFVFNFP